MDIRYPAVLEAQENGAILVRFVDLEDTFTERRRHETEIYAL